MKNRWSESEASEYIVRFGDAWGEDLALRTYASRLIGEEAALVLHGGGNTSVKSTFTNVFGEQQPAIFVKASGHDLASIEPEGHAGLALSDLRRLRSVSELSDAAMVNELRTHLFDADAATPSIEALLHAFLPQKFIDHTHADAILALTNRPDGVQLVAEVLGDDVIVLEYILPGFDLARAVADAFDKKPEAKGMILMKHGLLTWGETAPQSYAATIELVSRAEAWLKKAATKALQPKQTTSPELARQRYRNLAPILRGCLAIPTQNADAPYRRFILQPLIGQPVLDLLDSDQGREVLLSPPLTTDHLIRTKPLPLWLDGLQFDDVDRLREQIVAAIAEYAEQYDTYYRRYAEAADEKLERLDAMPRTILIPGVGAVCVGRDIKDAGIVRDIAAHTLAAKAIIAASGSYEGLSEKHLFDMEYRGLQHAKLAAAAEKPLQRSVALVTGACGAIGSGICRELLANGCHVAATDLPGDQLESLAAEFSQEFGGRIIAVPLDVTDEAAVEEGFAQVIEAWGGIDLIVINAGLAHVSSLADMQTAAFRKLEKVNVEGTLHMLSESARHFKAQGTGGDIVLISTKNVFAPGAKFGAYSATKAASHQLARIASLELAEFDVRVNMVAPDGVFGDAKHKSGLWAEVGPDRMRARGLDEQGLEEYYRDRNLLRQRITAEHVARAVMFFATRQTPTTGATIPVDGGLPDATPR